MLYSKAEEKIQNQLDVVNILRWIEQLKLLSKGLLNHKQKFWLKLQKEHLLEIDYDSNAERIAKKKELATPEFNDLVDGLNRNDKKAIAKVNNMLKYLQHGNRTAFDLKIIQGIFEEYCSDSDDEGKAKRAMNTEEEHEEFYSLKIDIDKNYKNGRGKQGKGNEFDLDGLRNLYAKDDGIVSIGNNNPHEESSRFSSPGPKKAGRYNKSSTYKKKQGGTSLTTDSRTRKNRKMKTDKVLEINEDEEEEDVDTDENNRSYINPRTGSIMDPEHDDFLVTAEKHINESSFKAKARDNNSSEKGVILKSSSENSQKLDSEEEKENKFSKGSNTSSGNKIVQWNNPNKKEENANKQSSQYRDSSAQGDDVKFQ